MKEDSDKVIVLILNLFSFCFVVDFIMDICFFVYFCRMKVRVYQYETKIGRE